MITFHGHLTTGEMKRNDKGNIISYTEELIYTVDDGEAPEQILSQPQIPSADYVYQGVDGPINSLKLQSVIVAIKANHDCVRKYVVTLTYGINVEDTGGDGGGGKDKEGTPLWNTAYDWTVVSKPYVYALLSAYAMTYDPANDLKDEWQAMKVHGKWGRDFPHYGVFNRGYGYIPAKQEVLHTVITFKYNLKEVDRAWMISLKNKVNIDALKLLNIDIEAFTAKITNTSITEGAYGEVDKFTGKQQSYNIITMSVEIKEDGWGQLLPNTGVYAKLPEGSEAEGNPRRLYIFDGDKPYGVNGSGIGFKDDLISDIDNDTGLNQEDKDELKNSIRPLDDPVPLDENGEVQIVWNDYIDGSQYKVDYIGFMDTKCISFEDIDLPTNIYDPNAGI